jgi:hypothetical protein
MRAGFWFRFAVIMVCAASTAGRLEAAQSLQPGQWNLTSKSERNGVTNDRAPVTRCISAEQAKDIPRRPTADTQHPNCSTADIQDSGNAVSFRTRCTGQPSIETIASFAIPDPQHYTATFKTTVSLGSKTTTSVLTVQGVRTGECAK